MKIPCIECGKTMKRTKTEEVFFGVNLGTFPCYVCPSCHEKVYDEAAVEAIEKEAKKRGVWGLGRKVKVTSWGRTLGVRIPVTLQKSLGFKSGMEIEMIPDFKNKTVVMKAVK